MKKNYEKFKPKRKSLEKWQIATIIGGGCLLLIATIVFIVLFAKNIFSEMTFAYCCVGLLLAFLIGGFFIFAVANKKG